MSVHIGCPFGDTGYINAASNPTKLDPEILKHYAAGRASTFRVLWLTDAKPSL